MIIIYTRRTLLLQIVRQRTRKKIGLLNLKVSYKLIYLMFTLQRNFQVTEIQCDKTTWYVVKQGYYRRICKIKVR